MLIIKQFPDNVYFYILYHGGSMQINAVIQV